MSYLNHLRTAFFLCLGFTASISVPMGHAQTLELEEGVTLEADALFGAPDEDDEELSRLVDKSTIADLDFLYSGDAPTSIDQLKTMQDHVANLYGRVESAVVNIQSGRGQGSGVVVTSDGYVLTAAHVISIPNRSAIITFPDGTRARAQTLGLMRSLDAGLLKIYAMVPEEEEASDNAAEKVDEEKADDKRDEESDSEKAEEDSDEEDSDEMDEEESGKSSEADKPKEDEDADSEKNDAEEIEAEPTEPKDRFAVQDDLPSFSYLEIGNSEALKLGQWVVAVGHPGGLDEDRGIVLRVGRVNEIETENEDAYVCTDCTLVGGDSGGPLIGMDGSVIGIHSRIGIRLKQNFHVPSNEFLNNWTSLLEPVVHDREAQLSVRFRGGTNVIESVPRRSLARRNGLKASDRIIRIGDKDIYDKLQFDDAISDLKPYQKIEIEIQRKGKKMVINVTIGEKATRGLR